MVEEPAGHDFYEASETSLDDIPSTFGPSSVEVDRKSLFTIIQDEDIVVNGVGTVAKANVCKKCGSVVYTDIIDWTPTEEIAQANIDAFMEAHPVGSVWDAEGVHNGITTHYIGATKYSAFYLSSEWFDCYYAFESFEGSLVGEQMYNECTVSQVALAAYAEAFGREPLASKIDISKTRENTPVGTLVDFCLTNPVWGYTEMHEAILTQVDSDGKLHFVWGDPYYNDDGSVDYVTVREYTIWWENDEFYADGDVASGILSVAGYNPFPYSE